MSNNCDFCVEEDKPTYHMCHDCYEDFWLADAIRFVIMRIPQKARDVIEDVYYWICEKTEHRHKFQLEHIHFTPMDGGEYFEYTATTFSCSCGQKIIEPTDGGILRLQEGWSVEDLLEGETL